MDGPKLNSPGDYQLLIFCPTVLIMGDLILWLSSYDVSLEVMSCKNTAFTKISSLVISTAANLFFILYGKI